MRSTKSAVSDARFASEDGRSATSTEGDYCNIEATRARDKQLRTASESIAAHELELAKAIVASEGMDPERNIDVVLAEVELARARSS